MPHLLLTNLMKKIPTLTTTLMRRKINLTSAPSILIQTKLVIVSSPIPNLIARHSKKSPSLLSKRRELL